MPRGLGMLVKGNLKRAHEKQVSYAYVCMIERFIMSVGRLDHHWMIITVLLENDTTLKDDNASRSVVYKSRRLYQGWEL